MEAGEGFGIAGVRALAALQRFESQLDALLGIKVKPPGVKQDAVTDAQIHFPARNVQGHAWYGTGCIHRWKIYLAVKKAGV
jgi:hypothetical protein